MSDPYAYSELGEDQREIWQSAQQVLAGVPDDAAVGADLGWFGVGAPEELGGSGGTAADLAPILECIGIARSASATSWTAGIVLPLLVRDQNPSADLLRGIVQGRVTVAVAAQTGLVEPAGEFSILALGAHNADLVAVPLALDGGDLLALVGRGDRTSEAVVPTDQTRPWGRHTIRLESIPSRACYYVGGLAAQWRAARNRAFAVDSVGVASAALRTTVDYALQRHQFGRPIAGFQAYKHRLVDCLLRVKLAQSLAYRAFADPEDLRLAAAAAVESAPSATGVCGEAVQLHGAIGLTHEAGIGTMVKRARANEVLVTDHENTLSLTC